ncbi:GFA family protein [Roseobacter sp. YSTF-M11]|uniref:GFA family protein n=1 Tax=Roseobacter insulae TaxID=2859783 RepID=A0A9X1FTD9_9RHOB|nr:GFA family protein [Roseobacter insulae]MBW4706568.1 GFA family protein [Roseobacter insulae]
MSETGGCLCGAVKYTLTATPKEIGACHCSMCRKWSGGVFLGMEVPSDGVSFTGADNLTTYASSPWAERAFCKTCGSSVYYRVTAPGPHEGTYHFGYGTLEGAKDVPITGELFIDEKPSGYSFSEKTHQMTAEEVMAMFAPKD